MSINKCIIVLSMSIVFMACTGRQSENRMGKQLYTMEELPHKRFLLDDSTTQVLSYIHTFMEGDSLRLASYNKPLNNICIFDVESGSEIRKIQFQKEGPNALGNNIAGFFVLNKDSVLVYHTWINQLDLFDGKGEILKSYKLKGLHPQQGVLYSAPSLEPSTSCPIKKVGTEIILQGHGRKPSPEMDSLRRSCTLIFNVKDSTVRYANAYPSCYEEETFDKWHVWAHRIPRYDISPQNEMVLSFPIDDSIRVFNLHNEETHSFFAGHSTPYRIRPASAPTVAE